MISRNLMQHSAKSASKNECNGKIAPIIKSRIPLGLQMVFLASNRGETVHVPPPLAVSSICRNWQEVSTRTPLKRSARFDIPFEGSDSSLSLDSPVAADNEYTLASMGDFPNSSVDSCDMDLLEELDAFCKIKGLPQKSKPTKKATPVVSRWEATRRTIKPKQGPQALSRWETAKKDLPPQNIRSSRWLSPTKTSRVLRIEV